MPLKSRKSASGCALFLGLAAAITALPVGFPSRPLAEVHLPGGIASDASVGLAISARGVIFAAYWTQPGRDRPFRFAAYKFDGATGNLMARTTLATAEPLRSRNGHAIPSPVETFLSPDGSVLLCATLERGPARKIWTLSSRDLRVLGSQTIPANAHLLGFSLVGQVRLVLAPKGGLFGQEIRSATVLDLDVRSLRQVRRRLVRFEEPAWRMIAVGKGDLLWAFDERPSRQGAPRITAYSLQNGRPVATREIPLREVPIGTQAPAKTGSGGGLQPPATIPQPGVPAGSPQIAQLIATRQAVIAVIQQPESDPVTWSRLVRIGSSSIRPILSPVLAGCDLALASLGRAGRTAVGSCDVVGRGLFDRYAIKKSSLILISTTDGSVIAEYPLSAKRPPLSLAVDDGAAIAAVYDHRGIVRVLPVPPTS